MKYDIKDLKELVKQLRCARAKRKERALQLGIFHGDLEAIDQNFHGNPQKCLIEVLALWLCSDAEKTSEQLALSFGANSWRD